MIRINDDYVIDVDSLNYTVMRDYHKIDKDGKQILRAEGYYTTLEKALLAVREMLVKKSLGESEYTLESALTCVRTINNEFVDTFRKVVGD